MNIAKTNTAKTKIFIFALDILVQFIFIASAVSMVHFVGFVLFARGVLTLKFLNCAMEYRIVFFSFLAFVFPALIALMNLLRLCSVIISGRAVGNRIVLDPPYIVGLTLFRLWRLQNLTFATLVLCLFVISLAFVDPYTRTHALVFCFIEPWGHI